MALGLLIERQVGPTDPIKLEHLIRAEREALELIAFERRLSGGAAPTDYLKMSGTDFEAFLGHLFKQMGYSVIQTQVSNDQGADLLLERFGERIVVQAKRYAGAVGNDAVQQVVAAVKHYQAHRAMVVTTSRFTRAASELARSNSVDLIDGEKLKVLIEQHLA